MTQFYQKKKNCTDNNEIHMKMCHIVDRPGSNNTHKGQHILSVICVRKINFKNLQFLTDIRS